VPRLRRRSIGGCLSAETLRLTHIQARPGEGAASPLSQFAFIKMYYSSYVTGIYCQTGCFNRINYKSLDMSASEEECCEHDSKYRN